MAINVIGFRWGDSDENHKYDYEALENKPSTDLGVLDIDTTAEQGTDDGDLYRAIHSFSWDSVINTLSGILNVKKLFTNIVNQVKSNKDKLDDPGQILEDGIGSLSTASSVINSDRFIIKENDGSIKQVTPLNTLRGGVRNLTTVVSFLDRFIPTISTSDASEINKAPVSSVVRAGIYNLASGSASDLNSDLSDSIVVQTEAEAGALDPAYVEKHTLSEIHDLFGIDDLKTTVSGHTTSLSTAESDIDDLETRATTAESNITSLQNNKVDMTTPLLNFDDTAVDPTTDDGALANALNNLGILSTVALNGMLYIKKTLTEYGKKIGGLIAELSSEAETLTNELTILRYGKVRVLLIGNPTSLATGDNLVYTLAQKDRPLRRVVVMLPSPIGAISSGGTQLSLRAAIETNGQVRIYNYRSVDISGDTNAAGTVTWIIA